LEILALTQSLERGQTDGQTDTEATPAAMVKGKGKVFTYSLPSVGPGADPGVQAVSPKVT